MSTVYRPLQVWRNGRLLVELQVFQAFNPWQRARGLLARPSPGALQGHWLQPCNAVHSWFMGYAIDVLFLDAQGRVIKRVASLKPWRMVACRHAHSVIELAAGEAERLSIEEGDLCLSAA
jgi:uncharacterized membrane protein (UPF0127 family)